MKNYNELAQEIYEANKAKGFWDKPRSIKELLTLINSELGEAVDAHRKSQRATAHAFQLCVESGDDFVKSFKDHVKDTVEDEIADTLIRVLDMAGGLGIEIDDIENMVAFERDFAITNDSGIPNLMCYVWEQESMSENIGNLMKWVFALMHERVMPPYVWIAFFISEIERFADLYGKYRNRVQRA